MNEHLFLGDSTYPHDPEKNLAEKLREWHLKNGSFMLNSSIALQAADRIEQLERELKQEKTRYTGCLHMLIAEQDSKAAMQSKIDSAISEVKA